MRSDDVGKLAAFDTAEGLQLALAYLDDPGNIHCPRCGPGTVEVMAYLEPDAVRNGVMTRTQPDGDFTVVLYCHGCRRAAALDFSPTGQSREDAA